MSRCLIAVLAVFIFVVALDFAVHGWLLTDYYKQTYQLWRPQEDYIFYVMTISQALYAIIVSYLYSMNHQNKGIMEGVRFGLVVGLLLATFEIGRYSFMPVPFMLSVLWADAMIVKGLGTGIILSLVCCKCEKSNNEG